jgi:hypothetical protein
MAENKETIVLEINASDALSQIANMQKELDMLRTAQKEFTTDSVEYQKMASAIRIVSKEQSDLKRTLDASVKARQQELDTVNFGNNSIKQNRELLKQLTAQYVEMKNPTTAMTVQIKSLSDTLKGQEKAIGDNRREVGNYKESIKSAFGELSIGGKSVGALGSSLGGLSTGFKAAGGGLKGLAAGFAALGIPLIVMAFQALIDIMSGFKPIADAVESSVVGLKAAFGALISGGSISEAVKQSQELLNVMRDLEDTQGAFSIQMERANRQIQSYIVQSKRKGITEAEALSLVEKANEVEKKIFDERTKRNKVELDAAYRAFKQKYHLSRQEVATLLYGTNQQAKAIRERIEENTSYNEEELNQLQDLALEREKIATESVQLQDKLANRTAAITEKSQKSQTEVVKKETKTRAQLEEEAAKARAAEEQRLYDLAKFRLDQQADSLEKRLDLFDLESAKTIENMRKLGASQIEIDQYIAEQRLKVEQDFYTQQGQQMQQAMQKQAAEQKAFDDQIKQNREYDAKIMQEFRISQAQMDAEYAAGNYENSKALYEAKKALKDKELADSKKKADEERMIEQATFESAQSLTNTLAQIGNVMMGNSAAGLAFQKVLAGVQIGIDTAKAISSVIAAATAEGAFAGPAAIFVTVAKIASGIATVTANMMKATQLLSSANTPEAPEMQTFAEGGRVYTLGGRRHSEGGTKFYGSDGTRFEAERGEKIFVMKRTASSAIDRLGSFNQLYGGRPWSSTRHAHAEDGGLVFDGGMTSRSFNQPNITEQLRNALTNMPPAVVSVKEINTVNTRRTIAQEQAGL